ncbi:MAG: glycine betaine ABC transporter substrate-binding protein, partial [Steroidobacteraceae bacterium]
NDTNTAMVYATDGGIAAANLVVLVDDKHDQPVYAPVPLVRAVVLRAHPDIAALVKPLMESLDRETLQRLNERVQVDGEAIESVARDYLQRKGLLK